MKKLKTISGIALMLVMFFTINISTDVSADPKACEEGYGLRGVCWEEKLSECKPSMMYNQCNGGIE